MAFRHRFEGIGCAATVILLVILAIIDLESVPPVWWDEGWNFTIAHNWIDKGYYGRYLIDAPIPISPTNGFPVIASVALGFKLFGTGIWQGRILFTFLSLGALALIYHLAARLYGRAVGVGTLFTLTLMSAYPGLHPILSGRQALGDVPAVFFLLLGYAFFLTADKKALWIIPAVFFWAAALLTKLQVLPFWSASLLVPLAVLLYEKKWRVAALTALSLVGALITSQLLLAFLDSLLESSTLPTPRLAGLYQVTALVTSLPARLFTLIAVFEFGLPTLLGLGYGLREFLRDRQRIVFPTHAEVVKLALLVLACSWFAWYLTLSVGWVRYLFPATFVGSIFVAAMLYDLTDGFNFTMCFREFATTVKSLGFNVKSFGVLLVAVLVGMSVMRTLITLRKTYVLDADASVQEVAHFINTQTPTNALVETYDSELFFLLRRRYHYPPDQLHIELVRRTFLYDDNVHIDYDPLLANPDYLIVGPHSKQWRLYDHVLNSGAFRLRQAYSRYEIYERVR
jgi:hypothetical protein